jgi:DNA-binding Lrp family transcriptional regulator
MRGFIDEQGTAHVEPDLRPHSRGMTGEEGFELEVLVDIDIRANDIKSLRDFETTVAGYEDVLELRRMCRRPDYFIRVALADHAAYETFLTSRLIRLPAVERVQSYLTMKRIRASD